MTSTVSTSSNIVFSTSVDEIRELHANGKSIEEIAEKTNLSPYIVNGLVERFILKWDHYSGLPSPKAYENE